METIEQGSKEWLAWRKLGIGASESAALLGLCPHKTILQLYNEKTTNTHNEDGPAGLFRKGHETEAAVRARYELETGLEFPPALFIHPEYDFIRASLDGWNEETKRGIEIKYVGKDSQGIKPHHQIQVQHQMLVTGAKEWTYITCSEGGVPAVMTIPEDLTIQSQILAACWQFWHQIQKREAPEPSDRDWVTDQRQDLVRAVEAMREAKTTKESKACREVVLELARHNKTICNGVKITLVPPRVVFPKDGADE